MKFNFKKFLYIEKVILNSFLKPNIKMETNFMGKMKQIWVPRFVHHTSINS